MTETLSKNYELAYHITTDLDDAGVQITRQEIESLVTQHGGHITFSKDPERIRLSYEIKHQRFAHFGHVQFNSDKPEELKSLNDELKLKGNIIRFLLLRLEPESQSGKTRDMVRRLAMRDKKSSAPLKAGESKIRAPKAPAVAVNEKEIDKQLEDIIGKIEENK